MLLSGNRQGDWALTRPCRRAPPHRQLQLLSTQPHRSTVSHAVTVLGVVSVKTIVLGFSLVQNLRTQQTKSI
jgi:hypothetical protein